MTKHSLTETERWLIITSLDMARRAWVEDAHNASTMPGGASLERQFNDQIAQANALSELFESAEDIFCNIS
jgi:hypothetical protein